MHNFLDPRGCTNHIARREHFPLALALQEIFYAEKSSNLTVFFSGVRGQILIRGRTLQMHKTFIQVVQFDSLFSLCCCGFCCYCFVVFVFVSLCALNCVQSFFVLIGIFVILVLSWGSLLTCLLLKLFFPFSCIAGRFIPHPPQLICVLCNI